jgi:hypothetical protein
MTEPLRVVVLKPSKYTVDGYVERFRRGFMPNSTVPYVRSMTPSRVGGTSVEIHAIDLRRKTFGFDLVPLPRSLQLSAADTRLGRAAKLDQASQPAPGR